MRATGLKPLIRPDTTVREAVQSYPGIEAIFDRHGLTGCGGTDGPVEPVAFFAKVHEIDPAVLLADLNDFAARSAQTASVPLMTERPKRTIQPYLIAVSTALALAVFGGFPLGILAALGGGRDVGLGARWPALVQAHGHLQLIGFAGLFIIGVSYHALPRFKNTELALPYLALPSIALVASGALLRVFSQPWSESSPGGAMLVTSAALEITGVGAFVAIVTATLARAQRQNYDYFLLAAVVWLLAASAANLLLAGELAQRGTSIVPDPRNVPLLEMYLFGFITLFILGVSMRVLPHFMSLRTARMRYFMPALVIYDAALVASVGSGWLDAYTGWWSEPEWLAAISVYAMAVAVLLYVAGLNIHLPAVRDKTSEAPGPHERLIRAAYVWLALALAIEGWFATQEILGGSRPDFLQSGAARHAMALGFVTQIIFGVGSRALPAFAGQKLYSARLAAMSWVLINVATVLRVGHALVPEGSATFRFDHIAVAGVAALLALLLFAFNMLRTVWPPQRRSAQKEKTMEIPAGTTAYEITPASIVADVLTHLPGSLDLLVGYGFKPLADPEMRARVTPHVTIATACSMHGIDVAALISDLQQLQAGGATISPRQRVLNALRECHDPELRVNIVDLGLVYEVQADERRASVAMTLTSPDCPAAEKLVAEARDCVRNLGFEEVDVRLVREPAWEVARMTPAARHALGWQ